MSKQSPERPGCDLDEWDAEIEAEFQRVTCGSDKKDGPSKRKEWVRHSTTVPREWELRLRQATRISTYRLALELLYQHWRTSHDKFGRADEPVIVSGDVMAEAGLSRRSVWYALGQLEGLGLIEVAHAKGRAPRAALLHTGTKT